MSKISTKQIDDLDDPEADAVWRKVPRSRTLRKWMKLSVEEFGARYRIPAETLHAWEARTETPDAVAEAYLLAIARDPEGMAKLMRVETVREAAE
jgi:DNA-binding transcriptional regulator YiaG